MYMIHIKKEKATSLPFTKIFIDDKKVAKTSHQNNNSFENDGYNKKLYMKGFFIKTNTIKTPEETGVYNLVWTQNYLFVSIFFILLVISSILIIGEADYTLEVRLTLMFCLTPIINFCWNDLLLLGRKIELRKLGED